MSLIHWKSWNCVILLSLLFAKSSCETIITDDQLYTVDAPSTFMDRLNSGKEINTKNIVELETSLGTINGIKEPTSPPHQKNPHMFAFRGIPFAKAPIGKLRLADTVDLLDEWPGRRLSATQFKPICPQYNTETNTTIGAEDCLYLNIYTPSLPDDKGKKKLLPVLVYIHGGGFIRGSSTAHGAEKLLTRDVVLVTINYRLGALGFLSTEDSVLPGNYGLLDQLSALRWVQRNIANFMGDPQQITAGGFSAGSASVHIHMFSPLTQGLFNQAILMSGSSFTGWGVRPSPLPSAKQLAKELGCPIKTSNDISSCLADKTLDQIVSAQAAIFKYDFYPMLFGPTVDKGWRSTPVLHGMPQELSPRPMPTIVGSVTHEGLLFSALVFLMSAEPRNVRKTYDEIARYTICPWHHPETEEAMKDLAESFYYNEHSKQSLGLLLEDNTELLSDFGFGHHIWDAAAKIAETGAPVFTYIFTHREAESPTWALPLYKKLEALGYHTPILKEAVSHGDDLIRIFSFPFALGEGSERDKSVTHMMVNMFANFIIYGSPQENLSDYQLEGMSEWIPIKAGQPVGYFNISFNPSMVYKPYRLKEQNFWRSVVPRPKPKNSQNFKKSSEEL